MISAKQINNLISQEKFDVDAAMKKVSELETLVAQAKEADKGGMNFSFINSAGQYQLEAKNTFAASEIKSRTLTGIKSNFRTQTQAGWSKTLSREHYASTTKWSMIIIACVKRFDDKCSVGCGASDTVHPCEVTP